MKRAAPATAERATMPRFDWLPVNAETFGALLERAQGMLPGDDYLELLRVLRAADALVGRSRPFDEIGVGPAHESTDDAVTTPATTATASAVAVDDAAMQQLLQQFNDALAAAAPWIDVQRLLTDFAERDVSDPGRRLAETFMYLLEFRLSVLDSYRRSAATILERAGKAASVWNYCGGEKRRLAKVLGAEHERVNEETPAGKVRAADIRRLQSIPHGKPVRVWSPLWVAAKLVDLITVVSTAIEDGGATLWRVPELDRAIIKSGNLLLDVQTTRAARS